MIFLHPKGFSFLATSWARIERIEELDQCRAEADWLQADRALAPPEEACQRDRSLGGLGCLGVGTCYR